MPEAERRGLEDQVRAYAQHLDAMAPSAETLALRTRTASTRPVLRGRPGWVTAIATAVAIVAVVGGAALLTRLGDRSGPADPTSIPPSSQAVTTFGPAPSGVTVLPDPVIDNGPEGSWNAAFVGPGALVRADDALHLFLTGQPAFRAPMAVGHAVSTDGATWTVGADPVIAADDVAKGLSTVSGGFVVPDGTWVLLFHDRFEGDEPPGVWRATAPTPQGPWSFDAQPVLTAGPPGAWDGAAVTDASVVATEDGYVMFYRGLGADETSAIGRAESSDGVTWTKHDDPATTTTALVDSDPVFVATQPWEAGSVARPSVVRTADRWLMLYGGRSLGQRGLATSLDGLEWSAARSNPILTTVDAPRAQIMDSRLFVGADAMWIYLESGGERASTAVYLARIDGLAP